jgi:hypothetical protein
MAGRRQKGRQLSSAQSHPLLWSLWVLTRVIDAIHDWHDLTLTSRFTCSASFIDTYVNIFTPAVGTAFASNAAQRDVFSKFVLDGLQWAVMYTPSVNYYDPSVVGRAIARKTGLTVDTDSAKLRNLTVGWYHAFHAHTLAQWCSVTHVLSVQASCEGVQDVC